jgi:hypothetical protein
MPVLGVVHSTKIGPNAPTITGVTDVGLNREYDNGAVDVAFTPPAANTAVSYIVTSSNGQTATGTTSPIRVQNLPTGINTTFTIAGINAITIEGPPSAVSSGVVVTTVPYKPTIGVATAGNGTAYVVFTILNSGGKPVISYLATGSPAGSGTDTASPITVTGLNNDVAHAFTIIAINANGPSLSSNPSNVVTPSATGGSGVPAGTFYCYSSDCFTSDGDNFAYLQAPIFTAVSPSDQSSLTNYSAGFGYARGTRVTYCNTVEATAAIGAQQSVCQVNYIPPSPPTPCDPTEYTSECGPYTAQPRVDGCSPTSADYGYTITELATKTRTTYDCNGIILTTAVLTCTKSTFTATTNNDPRCPGYRAPAAAYVPQTSSQTGATPTIVSTQPFTDPATGATYDVGTTSDGGTVYTPTGATPGDPLYIPPINFTLDFSGTDWSGLENYGGVNIDYDALQALIDSYAQPSTPATNTTVANDTTITTPFDTGTSTPSGGGGCFLFGTKITMANGSLKNIEDLKLGDELLTFHIPGLAQSDNSEDWYPTSKWSTDSTSNFTKTTTKVSHIRTGPFWRHYVINGQYRVTYEHMIFAKREGTYQFIRVDGLRLGDFFLDANKNEIEITNIEQVYVMSSTVELDVEENDMYFADGILVHNFYAYGGGGKW